MEETEPMTLSGLKEHFGRLGLDPSDEDLAGMLPAVEAFAQAARQVEALITPEAEPGTTLRLGE